jgi:hypothetical protein
VAVDQSVYFICGLRATEVFFFCFCWSWHYLEVNGQLHAPAPFIPPSGKEPQYPLYSMLERSQSRSGYPKGKMISDPSAVHFVASRYTYCVIAVPLRFILILYFNLVLLLP